MATAAAVVLNLVGKDKTAPAFNDVEKRANKAMGALKRMAVIAGAGIVIGKIASNAKQAIDELSKLSYAARDAGASTSDLTKLSGALSAVGIKGADIDSLSASFTKMAKETGRVGLSGFKETLADVAKLGSEQERLNALVKAFGKSGTQYAAMVREGPEVFLDSLDRVMASMPGVDQAAADAGNRASTLMQTAAAQIKTGWLNMVGSVLKRFEDAFGLEIGQIFNRAVNWIKYFGKAFTHTFEVIGSNVGAFIGWFLEDWKGAMMWLVNPAYAAFKAVGQIAWEIIKGIGRLFADLGKQIWRAIKGEDTDFSGMFDRVIEGAQQAAKNVSEVFSDQMNKVKRPDWVQFEKFNFAALKEETREAIRIADDALEAQKTLATGVIAGVGDKAKKAIKELNKEAQFMEAGSEAAIKAMFGARGASAGGAALSVKVSGEGQEAATQAAKSTANGIDELVRMVRTLVGGFQQLGVTA